MFHSFLILVGGFLALDGVVWNRLRSNLSLKVSDVWDHYLKPMENGVRSIIAFTTYYFPENGYDLKAKLDWLSRYGNYGPLKLYPRKLLRQRTLLTFLSAAKDFSSKVNNMLMTTKNEGPSIQIYYAFDHWGIRKFSPDERSRVDQKDSESQKTLLDKLDLVKKDEIASLVQSWERLFAPGRQIVSILEAFSNENGIMPSKQPTLLF